MMMKSLQARAGILACGVLLGGGRLDSCARRETGGDLGSPEAVGRISRGWRERSGEIPECLGDLAGKPEYRVLSAEESVVQERTCRYPGASVVVGDGVQDISSDGIGNWDRDSGRAGIPGCWE